MSRKKRQEAISEAPPVTVESRGSDSSCSSSLSGSKHPRDWSDNEDEHGAEALLSEYLSSKRSCDEIEQKKKGGMNFDIHHGLLKFKRTDADDEAFGGYCTGVFEVAKLWSEFIRNSGEFEFKSERFFGLSSAGVGDISIVFAPRGKKAKKCGDDEKNRVIEGVFDEGNGAWFLLADANSWKDKVSGVL
jgi:hypothetical protein